MPNLTPKQLIDQAQDRCAEQATGQLYLSDAMLLSQTIIDVGAAIAAALERPHRRMTLEDVYARYDEDHRRPQANPLAYAGRPTDDARTLRAIAFLESARLQLEQADDVDLDEGRVAALNQRLTYVGRAVDDLVDGFAVALGVKLSSPEQLRAAAERAIVDARRDGAKLSEEEVVDAAVDADLNDALVAEDASAEVDRRASDVAQDLVDPESDR